MTDSEYLSTTQLSRVTFSTVSPSGNKIVFVRTFERDDTSRWEWNCVRSERMGLTDARTHRDSLLASGWKRTF